MTTETNQVFAYRFNQAITEHGWNLSDLARRVGVTPQAAQKWAKGISIPRGKKMKLLAEVTGKPEHWYFMQPDTDDPELVAQLGLPKNSMLQKRRSLASLTNFPKRKNYV